ncbi:hypothetical protein [Halapricum hydrolyticum]|uniref:Uncharacterized protein n=1 Tax=Halapricum hydrolyticum TaxID=2979991 RepID=A0AAE3LIX5_9EURY|nr:hypothetical protein [Halapricum hydrolyticum]MCU4717718.1 hypothetical protein [Halapricum hydrolyticum]MCU4726753.1 hypothetical protein [Halapricum hydrolyticum]
MSETATPRTAVESTFARTRAGIDLTVRRRDGRSVLLATTVGYLVIYLWAIGHLVPGLGGYDVFVVADPLGRLFQPALGPLSFEPVARVRIGPLTYLFSFNTVLGLGVALLVGLNLAVTTVAWRQPASCGVGESSAPLLAGVPAVLSGSACCGPIVLIAFGIQASSTLLTAFQFLLPVSVLLLVGTLLVVVRQFEPEAIE